jgi:hypothetical protein
MSSPLRKIQRGIDRAAAKKLYVQLFVYRPLFEDLEAALAELPEADRPKDAVTAIHSLIGSWLQGRRDAKRKETGLIEIAGQLPGDKMGELTRRLKLEEEK